MIIGACAEKEYPQMEREWTIKEIADELGITRDAVLKIARGKLGLGTKDVGMWWFTADDVSKIKANCRKYRLAQRRPAKV